MSFVLSITHYIRRDVYSYAIHASSA